MSNKPVIVLDPGHGGTKKIGGSSPNNAVGPNGLLEKNLTLDMANRVAATLAAQAEVFLTRAGDTNLGLADRAKLARDRNARIFLSLHFNGFQDKTVDGTEVWVAKKANQISRDFASTLLGQVVSATHLKDRGIREGDLGVILPSRHAAQTSACLLEISFLTNPDQAHELEKDAYRQSIADSICAGVRQYLTAVGISQSLAGERFNTTVLDDATMDQLADELGYGSLSNYVSTVVKPATLFGLSVSGGLNPDFYKKLQAGEKAAALLIHPDGSPVTRSEWGISDIGGCQTRRRGWHPWGLAVDIDYIRNPYVMHESGETAMDALVAPVYQRIARFMLKRDSVVPKGITERVKGETKKARVSRLYDSLREESEAMKTYFKAMQDPKALQDELNRHDLFDGSFWEKVWGVKDQTPSLDQLQEIMMRDYVALSGQTGPAIAGKTYPDPKIVFKGLSGDAPFVKRKPEKGFLALRKEVVTALTDAGLRWGAIDFGDPSGDVMHFDDGWGTLAGKITAAKKKLAPKAKGKSLGYEDEFESEGFDYAEPFGGGKTWTVADVAWAADRSSIDYRHLGQSISTTPFELTTAHLTKLCEANFFNPKSNPTDPRDEVIFALRGCQLADGKESSGGLVSKVKLVEAIPDHQQSKCVIGVWKRSTNQLATFSGSTVPYWGGMKKQLEKPSDKICNLLPTGRYLYTVGTHRSGEAEFKIPGAIRQQSDVAILRTKDNLIYEVTDEWDFGNPGDNIHPSRHPNPTDKFSSEGCLTVPGGGTFMTRTDKHDRLWSEFRKAAGLTAASAPESEDGFQFVLMLLTGREARLAGTLSKNDLTRLRFGSEGVDVKTLQLELSYTNRKAPKTGKYYSGKLDGNFSLATARAYIEWQKDNLGWADDIVQPAIAKHLGFDIINHLCLKDPSPLPKTLDADAQPRKLTDDEIDYYKKLGEKQNKGLVKCHSFIKRTFDEDIVWELPDGGEGYTIYNRNDLAGRKGCEDDKGLDEIGTKQTIERIIMIAREWNNKHADQPLQIGDISRPGGIDTPDHETHMDGKAFDMRLLRKKDGTGGFTFNDTKIYSPDLTKEFIRMVRRICPDTTFHFNDPEIYEDAEFKSFVTFSKGHDNHLHVMLK
ncbi:MAG: N-acetylmuramoyl-L-alanine amidase [Pyrinomonadaceae bacterium]